MSKTETATKWMEKTAKDNSHGYDQRHRWGEDGDYDCSAAVIIAWQIAGVPVKTNGATYTGNIYKVFTKSGFKDVTSSVSLKTGLAMKRGDVLLAEGHHVAMYCGNFKEVEASINEKGKAIGGKPGDQTGREFLIRSYRNYPWTKVLRFDERVEPKTHNDSVLRRGSKGKSVKIMQNMLIACGYSCGSAGADGEFGTGTYNALTKFQTDHGIIADGEYGSQSKKALTASYKASEKKKSIKTIAKEVIAGKWGSGDERNKKLKAAGYDPTLVQTSVNNILKSK